MKTERSPGKRPDGGTSDGALLHPTGRGQHKTDERKMPTTPGGLGRGGGREGGGGG